MTADRGASLTESAPSFAKPAAREPTTAFRWVMILAAGVDGRADGLPRVGWFPAESTARESLMPRTVGNASERDVTVGQPAAN
jgi:hypothetical protein